MTYIEALQKHKEYQFYKDKFCRLLGKGDKFFIRYVIISPTLENEFDIFINEYNKEIENNPDFITPNHYTDYDIYFISTINSNRLLRINLEDFDLRYKDFVTNE
jgi:hypothetical protein